MIFLFLFFLKMQIGDQIVEVNGVDFTNVDHKEVKSWQRNIMFSLCATQNFNRPCGLSKSILS